MLIIAAPDAGIFFFHFHKLFNALDEQSPYNLISVFHIPLKTVGFWSQERRQNLVFQMCEVH